ncbi:MAG: peptide ABC transporter ATP-binding protein [Acidobacteria bacterium]|nr:MAG: peptide ABC transporter ATP-binding protein [Acidobacteriota bacterium]
MTSLLEVSGLTVELPTVAGWVRPVNEVSLRIDAGESLGLVGESGSGKTMLSLAVMGLLPPGARVSGEATLTAESSAKNLTTLTERQWRDVRGSEVSMVFQEPMTSLNPVMRAGAQIEEAIRAHQPQLRANEAKRRTIEALRRAAVPEPEIRAEQFPHQLSGGLRQRVMIAMALAAGPRLLIADEPTTALDVTVQASIIELIRDLSRELRASVILITHNMALVASLCNRVIVMYAGSIVEEGPTRAIFKNPQHPYTWSLLRSMPRVDEKEKERLISIKGLPPDLGKMPPGCKFHPRCKFRVDRCFTDEPPLEEVDPGQHARCWVLMKNVTNPEAQAQT